MPIDVTWKNEAKNTINLVLSGRWSLQEFYEANQKANEMVEQVFHPVHITLDVHQSKTMPDGFMNAISNISRKAPVNMGILVMVGINPFARAFIRWYRLVYPRKPGERIIQYAGNEDEAQAIIDALAETKDKVDLPT